MNLKNRRYFEAAMGDGAPAGGAAPAAAAAPPAQQQQSANASWYGELPADRPKEFTDWVSNKQFKDPVSALESQYNLEKLIGFDRAGRTLVKPKDENDVEGMKAFRAGLGVPETPDAYELPLPEGDSGEFAKAAASWMHKAGVPKTAAQEIAKSWNEHMQGLVAADEAADVQKSEQELGELKQTWGAEYTQNEEFARRGMHDAAKRAGWSDEDTATFESAVGTAKMLKMFAELGKANAEPAFAGNSNPGFGTMNKAAAQTKLNEINAKRSAGEISDKQWKETYEAEVARLAPIAYGS